MLLLLAQDSEVLLRQSVAEQAPGLCSVLAREGGEEGYQLFLEQLLPVLKALLAEAAPEPQGAASAALVSVGWQQKEASSATSPRRCVKAPSPSAGLLQ